MKQVFPFLIGYGHNTGMPDDPVIILEEECLYKWLLIRCFFPLLKRKGITHSRVSKMQILRVLKPAVEYGFQDSAMPWIVVADSVYMNILGFHHWIQSLISHKKLISS